MGGAYYESPILALRTWLMAYGGAKISRDPVQSACLQGILAVPLLASILRS